KRCRAPLREEEPPVEFHPEAGSLGEVCIRCEAYNEPGLTVCGNCGAPLSTQATAQPAPDQTPPEAFTPPTQVPETLSEELRALAISDEEAAEAGLTMGNGSPLDQTPPDPFAAPGLAAPPPSPGRARRAA